MVKEFIVVHLSHWILRCTTSPICGKSNYIFSYSCKVLKIDLYFYRGTESQVQKNRRKARRLLEELEFIKVQHFSHKIFVILV